MGQTTSHEEAGDWFGDDSVYEKGNAKTRPDFSPMRVPAPLQPSPQAPPPPLEDPIAVYDRLTKMQQQEQIEKHPQMDPGSNALTEQQEKEILASLPPEVRQRNPKIVQRVKYVASGNTHTITKKQPVPTIKYVEKVVEVPKYQEVIVEIPGKCIPRPQHEHQSSLPKEASVADAVKKVEENVEENKNIAKEESDERDVVVIDKIVQIPRIVEQTVAEPVIEERPIVRKVEKIVTFTKYVKQPDYYDDGQIVNDMSVTQPAAGMNYDRNINVDQSVNVIHKPKREKQIFYGGTFYDNRYIEDAERKRALIQRGEVDHNTVFPAVQAPGAMNVESVVDVQH